jgi:N-acyl-D-aspartate/D-glutamate deacylase
LIGQGLGGHGVHDLVIRGGDVIDGSGAKRRRADVAIDGDRVTTIGTVSGDAASVIDASGKIVAPGFIDLHTHYDAQAFWDSALTPSPLHGVTSVFAGNCGFSIAPLSDDETDQQYMMSMLARVEGIPLDSLREGVPWSWRSTAEYLDSLDGTLGINAGFMVGHSALRRAAMRADANQRAATDDEIASMKQLLHEGLDAGGMGFSSSWSRSHNDAERCMVPSRHATREELIALSSVVGTHEGTSLEFIPMAGAFEPWAIELMADMSTIAQRILNWNVLLVNATNTSEVSAKLEASSVAAARGGRVVALTIPQSYPLRLSFASGFVLDAIPGWEETMLLPLEQKLAVFRDSARRAELARLATNPRSPVGVLTDWSMQTILDVRASDNEQYIGRTIGSIAAEIGREPWDILCEIAMRDELATTFGVVVGTGSDDDWKTRVDIWRDTRTVVGASDAGAHLDMFGTFNYPTVLLAEAVRSRKLLELEEAIELLTSRPAELYGLVERGRLKEGWHADVVVFDPHTVASADLEMRFDLPGGAGRLYADSAGVEHVLVNGRPIVSEGHLTSERSGTVLRSGRDTRTPDLS